MKLRFLLVIGIVVFLGALAIFGSKLILAGHTAVTGWLWSGTTDDSLIGCSDLIDTTNCGGAGWVNLNHTNPPPYIPNPTINYGITIPAITTCPVGTGPTPLECKVGGFGWSSNLGWIDFAPTGGWPTTGCGGDCPTWPSRREGNNLTGWARIVSIANAGTNAGAWDGWIKLSGSSYGVTINPANGDVTGYGWSNELGWINFNANIAAPPSGLTTADIKADGLDGPITIPVNTAATITWTSTNATDCGVSPTGWTGTSNTAGNTTGPLTSSQTYTLNCTNSTTGGAASDSVTVNVSAGPPPQPDLTVDTLIITPSPPTLGTVLSFSGTVRNNIGGLEAGASQTRLRIDTNTLIDPNFNIFPAPVVTGALNPAEFEVENWNNVWGAAIGTHRIEVCADINNAVTEFDETNNCAELIFVVSTGPVIGGTLTCSGSPNPTYLSAGGAVTWTATGGTGSYNWTFSCPSAPACPSPASGNPVTVTYTATGNKVAAVTSGSSNPATCDVDVKPFKWREIIPFF